MFAIMLGWHLFVIAAGLAFILSAAVWHLGALTTPLLLGGFAGVWIYKLALGLESGKLIGVACALLGGAAAAWIGAVGVGALAGAALQLKRSNSRLHRLMRSVEVATVTAGPAFAAGWIAWKVIVENRLPVSDLQRLMYVGLSAATFAGFAYARWYFTMGRAIREGIDEPNHPDNGSTAVRSIADQ